MKVISVNIKSSVLAVLFATGQIQIALAYGQPVFQPPANTNPQPINRSVGLPNTSPNPRAVSLYNLGLTAYKQGSPESAVIFFRRACDLDPNLADAQYNLAVIYQTQKRFSDAIPRFQEVLRIKPEDPDAHFQLGVILHETGRLVEARQHLLAIAPNNIHFAEAQKRILNINNQMNEAQARMQKNIEGQNATQQPVNNDQMLRGQEQNISSVDNQLSAANEIMQSSQDIGSNPVIASNQAGQISPDPIQPVQNLVQSMQTQNSVQTFQSPVQSNASPAKSSANLMPAVPNIALRVIASGFSAPAGLAFDRVGNLYVANYMTNTIDRIQPDGTRTQFSSGINLRGPIGLVVDNNNNLYVANYHSGTIARITPAGVSTIIASGFSKPYYLTMDNQGNLYVSQQEDNSVVRIIFTQNKPVQ
jgi:Tfp pilus assembly protein PilF